MSPVRISTQRLPRCLWIGSSSDEFRWVQDHISSVASLIHCNPRDFPADITATLSDGNQADNGQDLAEHSADSDSPLASDEKSPRIDWSLLSGQLHDIDRILIAVPSRVDLSPVFLRQLQFVCDPVPVGLVLGSFWEGFRRTGWDPPVRAFYWHQWFDWICPWLLAGMISRHHPSPATAATKASFPSSPPRMSADKAATLASSASRTDILVSAASTSELHLSGYSHLVFAANRTAAEAIASTISSANGTVIVASPQQIRDRSENPSFSGIPASFSPDFVFWDDSAAGANIDHFDLNAITQLSLLRRLFPQSEIVVVAGSPRWDQWREWNQAGAAWLLGKPFRPDAIGRIVALSGRPQ